MDLSEGKWKDLWESRWQQLWRKRYGGRDRVWKGSKAKGPQWQSEANGMAGEVAQMGGKPHHEEG